MTSKTVAPSRDVGPAGTATYNAAQAPAAQAVSRVLAAEINRALPDAESRIWHRHPVWFLDGNPIVGYSVQKAGVRLMFWSGADFDEPGLNVVGARFKDASVFYREASAIKTTDLRRWLRKSRAIQWDYKNIVRRKGQLVPIAATRRRSAAVSIRVKRVYDPPSPGDGTRVLVDRLWPRGLTKDAARVDVWVRDIAPSNGLRQWYDHAAPKWREFQRRYVAELAEVPAAVATLRALVSQGPVTLLFSSRERERNNAVALAAWLTRRRRQPASPPKTRIPRSGRSPKA